MAINNRLGAAGTDLSQLPQGALNALGGSGTLQTAYTLANIMTPKAKEFDPALAALLYFTEMGKQASQPGATLLGSVVGSGQAPAAYMMKQAEAARAREAGIGKTAVQLAGVLAKEPAQSKAYTNTETGKIDYFTPRQFNALAPAQRDVLVPYSKPAPMKAVGTGSMLMYMDPPDAIQFLKSQGIEEGNDNYDRLLSLITVPTDENDPEVRADNINQPIIVGNAFVSGTPIIKDGKTVDLQIAPSPGAPVPNFVKSAQKRLAVLAAQKTGVVGKISGLLPQIDQGLTLLLGVKGDPSTRVRTGLDQSIFLPFKQFAVGAFGIDIPELRGQENLQSLSFAIAPGLRPPGSGSTSDMEFSAYRKSGIALENSAEANYINLYALGKRAEAAQKLAFLEEQMLDSGKYRSSAKINRMLKEADPGIFARYEGALGDSPAAKAEQAAWVASLPRGTVVNNGNGVINSEDSYVIIGWNE
jgi:hypothetical protein